MSHFNQLLDHKVEGEEEIHNLQGHDDVVGCGDEGQELDGVEAAAGHHPTAGRKLKEHGHHAEEVQVGVVDGEVEKDSPGTGRKGGGDQLDFLYWQSLYTLFIL